MKRLVCLLIAAALTVLLCACGAAGTEDAAAVPAASGTAIPTAAPTPTSPPAPKPTAEPEPEPTPEATQEPTPEPMPELPPAQEGWDESYLAFLEDNYDIIAALWPDGIAGVGFIDLDLDGTPEMILFDQGASATLGVQLFDLIDGQVYCVSSVQESAAGAFGDEYFSRVSVCASFFESFRLSETADGFRFWVLSANGTLESGWEEIVRFDAGEDGVLTPVSVCASYLDSDAETGEVISERYTVGGKAADAFTWEETAALYKEARDTGYEGRGVFLWNDMQSYDTTCDGLLAMAKDAAEACVPVS